MVELDDHLPLAHAGVVGNLLGIQHGPCGYTRPAQYLHCFVLGVVLHPVGDQRVDFGDMFPARLRRRKPRVAQNVLPANDLQEPLPMHRAGAGTIDIAIVVRPVALAGIDLARCGPADHHLVAAAVCCAALDQLGGKSDAREIHRRVLHRDENLLPLAGHLALVECAQDANGAVQTCAGVADRGTGFQWPSVRLTGDAHRAARGLADHVE